jgi:3-oxoacyl-[acyl-carrier-protein] synthase-1
MAHRVAVTGVGVLASVGGSYAEARAAVRTGQSGVVAVPEWVRLGMRSAIAGRVDSPEAIGRREAFDPEQLASMDGAGVYCAGAAREAIDDARLDADVLGRASTGCIVGSGISCADTIYAGGASLYAGQLRRVSPFAVLRAMASSCSANLASLYSIGGRSYSLSAACATSAHAVGHAFELIREGRLSVAIAGGGEHLNDIVAGAFNAMRTALSTRFSDAPEQASRPFDADRDGFVLAEGAGIVVLENLEHALARGAGVHAELVGYGATSGGEDLVLPEADGRSAAACMRAAIDDAGLRPDAIDGINAHATSTIVGDSAEAAAIAEVFGQPTPWITASKSITGHALGAAGVHGLVFCLAMLEGGFIAPICNLERRDPVFAGLRLAGQREPVAVRTVLCNSFGFGGSNASLVVRRWEG